MSDRYITQIRFGQVVNYLNRKCMVMDVYRHIAYLRDIDTKQDICVGLGDLVVAGLEPSQPPMIRRIIG